MTNGCLCCAVKSNAVMAIEKLMEKSGKFDYVLIETTGKILSFKFYSLELYFVLPRLFKVEATR